MTVDLRSGAQYAPRREDFMTRSTAVAPDGSCGCQIWLEFLERVTGGNAEMQSYLQRVLGYCLTGHTTAHALFFLYGTGANGKSVFINTITGIMGDYAITAPMEAFVEARGERHPTELAMLQGARLVVAVETEEGRRWNESRIKSLTGGDRIAARFMRGDFFEFTPSFKLMIAGNHKPSLRNVDEAIRRRLHLIPFSITIPPEERDPELQGKLKAEWPAILQWAIEGALQWRRQGLIPPEAVVAATNEYVTAEDSFGCWLEEETEPGSDWEFETTAKLYKSHKAWSEKSGEQTVSMRRFAQNLQARGYLQKRTSGKRGFSGIRFRRPNNGSDNGF